MAETPQPHDTPRRPFKEYEDNHFHDDDDVAPPPNDEIVPHTTVPGQPARPGAQAAASAPAVC